MASAVSNIHASGNGNERFNDEALSWDSRPFVHEASQAASEAISSRLKTLSLPSDGAQVLEIGCGTGILSFLIAKQASVARIVAVDAAQGMIDVLKTKLETNDDDDDEKKTRRKILPLALMLQDPDDPALPADTRGPGRQKFDLITSHLVLHHIPDLRSVLQTMYGCLAAGGRLMLTDFEDFGPEAKRFHPAGKMAGVARHGIDVREMTLLLEDVGFRDVDVKPAWTMRKTVEKFDGEFASGGAEGDRDFPGSGAEAEKGEIMEFPFLLCYAMKK